MRTVNGTMKRHKIRNEIVQLKIEPFIEKRECYLNAEEGYQSTGETNIERQNKQRKLKSGEI